MTRTLVDKRGIHLANELAEPDDDVLELVVYVRLRDGVRQRAPRVGEVAQHHTL